MQDFLEIAVALGHLRLLDLEDVLRDGDDFAAGALQHVGQPVDDRLQQRNQDGVAAGAAGIGFLGAQGKVWKARGS